ncbi:hypothetical protein HU734_013705 [Pseudomonas wayambapalatensis]|uniref:hypothetical protein n=1 Tax=unclassified Pseudomonas TaxID=196821 RepID=UPI0016441C5F|nr:hypothetical protein [Pseudomonas sp. RW3S2]MBC3419796.1 hypothetical protein [Pseudomonas sp. RW3S2]QXI41345.1 hypothetical protein HU734_013705 [Pseudomonas wayambapalatensis]
MPVARIIVFNPYHIHRLLLERLLNGLGQFQVLPVGSFDELYSVAGNDKMHFDLLIMSEMDFQQSDIPTCGFGNLLPGVRHAMIYGVADSMVQIEQSCGTVESAYLARVPQISMVEQFLKERFSALATVDLLKDAEAPTLHSTAEDKDQPPPKLTG